MGFLKVAPLILFFSSSFCSAVGFQINTDFSNQQISTDRKDGETSGLSNATTSDFGFSWRPRITFNLMDRKHRNLLILVGPYIRLPLVFSLSGYGSSISSLFSIEGGLDIGVSVFQFVRIFLSGSPYWELSYQSPVDSLGNLPQKTDLTIVHESIGLRVEVPILTLNSAEYDRKVEFGILGSFQADRIKRIKAEAPEGAAASFNLAGTDNSQKMGTRWLVGLFSNVRF